LYFLPLPQGQGELRGVRDQVVEGPALASAGGGARPGRLPPRRARGGVAPMDPSTWSRTPRNSPCPCGSGKKYKHCHGVT